MVFRLAFGWILAVAGVVAPVGDGVSEAPPGKRPQRDGLSVPAAAPDRDLLTPQQWRRSQRSVDLALAWLAARQKPDGSFPTMPLGEPGVTSLCLLAFLSQGHVPDEGRYGEVLHKGIDFVLKCQRKDGLIALSAPVDPVEELSASHTSNYNHAIGGLLLGESLGMCKAEQSRRVRAALDQAIAFSLRKQAEPKRSARDKGGWRYGRQCQVDDADLSITSWQLMMLRSCRNAGFDVPTQRIDEALGFVRRCFSAEKGSFMYSLYGGRHLTRSMAGAGILSLSLGGEHKTDQARTAGDWLLHHPPDRWGDTYGPNDRFLYSLFYCSQATFQLGGKYWNGFFPPVLDMLIVHQQPDGSWQSELPLDVVYGPSYATALAVLTLTTPNQLLPIFQR
ncbi:MAG: terpene cyclase/mutase family protein [Planctomycetes bacterium]|nr:terpene cyclase/mutase family protein [Planctomycetota bacterium]